MPEFELVTSHPLAGMNRRFGTTRLWAAKNLALVSVAFPLGEEKKVEEALFAAYCTGLPRVGCYAASDHDGFLLIRMGSDQCMIAFENAPPNAEQNVAIRIRGTAYTTDQTDAWVAIGLEGPKARAALERLCQLDLDDNAFSSDAAHRTVVDHLGVLLLRRGPDAFLLLSASSSAASFAHSLETSLTNVI